MKKQNPYLRLPDKPSYMRRALHHDYHRPARYMLTMSKGRGTPWLASVQGSISVPEVFLQPAGKEISEALQEWQLRYPEILN